jgi:hypothetical protein
MGVNRDETLQLKLGGQDHGIQIYGRSHELFARCNSRQLRLLGNFQEQVEGVQDGRVHSPD